MSIANDSEAVNDAMKGTQWSKAWSKTIARVDGCTKKKVRFGARSSNATVLPLHAFLSLTEAELEMEFRKSKEPAILYPPKLAVVR